MYNNNENKEEKVIETKEETVTKEEITNTETKDKKVVHTPLDYLASIGAGIITSLIIGLIIFNLTTELSLSDLVSVNMPTYQESIDRVNDRLAKKDFDMNTIMRETLYKEMALKMFNSEVPEANLANAKVDKFEVEETEDNKIKGIELELTGENEGKPYTLKLTEKKRHSTVLNYSITVDSKRLDNKIYLQ